MPSIRCCSVFAAGVFFFGGADFFFAKRLFFRYGEGCEGRASRATVGVTAKDNGGACFPLDFGITPTKGRQPSHPHRSGFFCSFHATCVPTCEWLATTDPPRLIALTSLPPTFIHFHPSKATTPPRKKQHSLLVLPSVHTIINFATKFFDILTKKQFEHPQRVFQVFQVFRVFQVFHFVFGPQNSPILVQIRTKQVFQVFQAGSP